MSTYRNRAYQLVDDGLIPAEDMMTACLKYMPDDMIEHMLFVNEYICPDEDIDE